MRDAYIKECFSWLYLILQAEIQPHIVGGIN